MERIDAEKVLEGVPGLGGLYERDDILDALVKKLLGQEDIARLGLELAIFKTAWIAGQKVETNSIECPGRVMELLCEKLAADALARRFV
jgi:hypothetical protein